MNIVGQSVTPAQHRLCPIPELRATHLHAKQSLEAVGLREGKGIFKYSQDRMRQPMPTALYPKGHIAVASCCKDPIPWVWTQSQRSNIALSVFQYQQTSNPQVAVTCAL